MTATDDATTAFVVVWFLAASVNMWVGGDAVRLLVHGRAPHLPCDLLAAGCHSRVCEVEVSLNSERPEWARAD